MHIERLLALMKSATDTDKLPDMERFLANAYNTQVVQDTIRHGGEDPRITSRDKLIADGAPLEAGRATTPCRTPSKRLPDSLAWGNERASEEKRRRLNTGESPMDFAQMNELRSREARAWKCVA